MSQFNAMIVLIHMLLVWSCYEHVQPSQDTVLVVRAGTSSFRVQSDSGWVYLLSVPMPIQSGASERELIMALTDPRLPATVEIVTPNNETRLKIEYGMRIASPPLVIRDQSGFKSSGACLILPASQLSCRYVAVTLSFWGYTYIVVVSSQNNNRISVNLKRARRSLNGTTADVFIVYDGTDYGIGDTIQEELNAYESFQILGNNTDFTGTKLSSTEPIAVISGGNYLNDNAMEQMPPFQSLGKKYVIGGFPGSFGMIGVTVKPIYHDTNVVYDDEDDVTFQIKKAWLHRLRLDTSVILIISANRRLLVVVHNTAYPRGVSMTAMPGDTWQNQFIVPVYRHSGMMQNDPIVVIIARKPCNFDLQVIFKANNYPFNRSFRLTWTEKDNFQVAHQSINGLRHSWGVSIGLRSCVFGGFLLSLEDDFSFGYPLGWDSPNAPFPKPTTDTSTVVDTTLTEDMQTKEVTTPEMITQRQQTTEVTTPEMTTQGPQTTEVTTPEMATQSPQTSEVTTPEMTTQSRQTTEVMTPEMATQGLTTTEVTTSEMTTQGPQMSGATPPQITTQNQETSPGQTSSHAPTDDEQCPCVCSIEALQVPEVTKEEKATIVKKIVKTLKVNVSTLTASANRKKSANDPRVSTTYIGTSLAVTMLGFVASFIVVPDFLKLCHYICSSSHSGVSPK